MADLASDRDYYASHITLREVTEQIETQYPDYERCLHIETLPAHWDPVGTERSCSPVEIA